MKAVSNADNSTRVKRFTDLFDGNLAVNIGAIIKGNRIKPRQLNAAVSKLYDQVYNPDISLKQMERTIDKMKKVYSYNNLS